jgi:hypothetical protein
VSDLALSVPHDEIVLGLSVAGHGEQDLRFLAAWLRNLADRCDLEADRHKYEQAYRQELDDES